MNPLVLSPVSRDDIVIHNAVLGMARRIDFVAGSVQYGVSFSPPQDPIESVLTLGVQLGEHLIKFQFSSVPPISLGDQSLEQVDISLLPEDVRHVVLEAFFEPFLEVLSSLGSGEARLVHLGESSSPVEDASPLAFQLSGNGNARWAAGQLRASKSLLVHLAQQVHKFPLLEVHSLGAVPVLARMIVGEVMLSPAEFSSIQPNDVLLLDDPDAYRSGYCRVIINRSLHLAVQVKDNRITFQSIMNEETPSESQNTPVAQPAAGGSFSIEELPIHITFEVGDKKIPLGELKALQPGFTFEMERSLQRPVAIRANGRQIGSGELVQVADRIGVRVVDCSPDQPLPASSMDAPEDAS